MHILRQLNAQIKLGIFSLSNKTNAIENVLLVEVTPTISKRGKLNLFVLYVASISKICGKARNIFSDIRCTKNNSSNLLVESFTRYSKWYSFSCKKRRQPALGFDLHAQPTVFFVEHCRCFCCWTHYSHSTPLVLEEYHVLSYSGWSLL